MRVPHVVPEGFIGVVREDDVAPLCSFVSSDFRMPVDKFGAVEVVQNFQDKLLIGDGLFTTCWNFGKSAFGRFSLSASVLVNIVQCGPRIGGLPLPRVNVTFY